MFIRVALLFALLAATDAGSAKEKLVESARRLNDKNDVDMSWIPNYSIKFQKCHSLVQVAGQQQGGGGGQQEGRNLYTQHLVEFTLCPSSTCTQGLGCSGGAKYIIGLQQFVQLYTEMKNEEKQLACETVRANCNNDDDASCYADAGLDYCNEEDNQEAENMERMMECAALENNNNNKNNNNNNNYNYYNNANYYREYFVGPYCAESQTAIHLGVFLDQGCTIKAESGVYESMNYGKSLPYSQSSLVQMDCISCQQVDDNDDNNNNNDDDPDVAQLCEESYQQAGKCESGLSISYPDSTSCDFIENILPKLDRANQNLYVGRPSGAAAIGFAWAFGVLSFFLGIYSFLLYRRLRRSKVALNSDNNNAPVSSGGSIA